MYRRYDSRSTLTGGLALAGLLSFLPSLTLAETIRVGLMESSQVRLTSDKSFFAQTVSGQPVSHAVLREMTVSPMKGVAINKKDTLEREVVFIPQPGESLSVNGTAYAGTIRINAEANFLSVVNFVELETYLDGVVASEMPADWPMEALKTQAVISRTYALYKANRNKKKQYDLLASVQGQVYKGKSGFHPRTHAAVTQTRGIVVRYEGEWALTFFHSTSADHTEDAKEVWGIDRPYLKGVSCPFGKASPYYTWERDIPLADLERAMAKWGVGTIATLAPFRYSKAGRVVNVRILHDQGEIIVKGEELRRLLGYRTLPSTRFQVDSFGETIKMRGKGFGHGVGLCQWGARTLAERGFTFDEIIPYYYPGVSLQTE